MVDASPSPAGAPRELLLLSGSFRAGSRSLAIAQAVQEHLAHCRCTLPLLDRLPFYSEDLSADQPAVVRDFLARVAASDGLVIVTPEYNHSIPAVLKNAIDWASRPAFASPLKGRPVTIISQAAGPVGGARVQAHLKLVLDSTLARLHPGHELLIHDADQHFPPGGRIMDPALQRRLARHLDDFLAFLA